MLESTPRESSETAENAAPAAKPAVGAAHRYYMLAVLLLVFTVSVLDRHIMNALIEPIRLDLGLSDTQIGFLTGVAFALIYAIAAFPAARLADSWSRTGIIAVALGVWSAMTMLCGMAQNAIQLFLARFGVGFGEAGGSAPSQALIGDIFPRHERATAMSVLTVSQPLGIAGGLMLGGWAQEQFDWRIAFLIAGVPGLLLVPLVLFTFPKRPKVAKKPEAAKAPPFLATIRHLLSIRTMPLMMCAATLQTLLTMGATAWLPAFFMREHAMSPTAVGASLGAALGAASLIGHLTGGPLLDWLGRRDLRWHFWVPTIAGPVAGVLVLIAANAAPALAIPLFGLQVGVTALFAGPLLAITMNLAPVTARATGAAVLTFSVNVIGIGLGPQVLGLFSDLLRPAFGEGSLRVAFMCMTVFVVPATILFLIGAGTYRKDTADADARNAEIERALARESEGAGG